MSCNCKNDLNNIKTSQDLCNNCKLSITLPVNVFDLLLNHIAKMQEKFLKLEQQILEIKEKLVTQTKGQ